MIIPVAVTLLLVLLYTVLIGWSVAGLHRLKNLPAVQPREPDRVTVIVPFHNEREQLQGIISDLREQSYPASHRKVFLVNDHSTDGSPERAVQLTEGLDGFECLSLPEGRSGKKQALAFAIQKADTPWIFQCDADCRIGPRILASHMSRAGSGPVDLVAGFVTVSPSGRGFIHEYQRFELLALAGAGAGSFAMGRALMCSGANLLYKKSLYAETRRFDPARQVASGDDMFLLIGARKAGRPVAFNADPEAVAETGSERTWRGVWRQRMRWGSKSARYAKADVQAAAILVAATHLAVMISPLWMVMEPAFLWALLPAIGIKTAAEFLMIRKTAAHTGQPAPLKRFLPVWLAYYPVNGLAILGSMTGSPSWGSRETLAAEKPVTGKNGE